MERDISEYIVAMMEKLMDLKKAKQKGIITMAIILEKSFTL